MAAGRASSAGVLWWHGDQMPAVPRQLVVQLATEPEPALTSDSDVLHCAQYVPAVAVAQPAELGQEQALVF